MKTAFIVFVAVHGLLHLIGAAKGSGLVDVQQLSMPISRTMSIVWLAACVLFSAYCVALIVNFEYAWMVGLSAVVVSQVLIVMYWGDARFGTIPNVLVVLVCAVAMGSMWFQRSIADDTERLVSLRRNDADGRLRLEDVTALPEPVRRWLGRSGALDQPRVRLGRVTQTAKLRMRPSQKDWLTATALQYTVTDPPGFIWSVDVALNDIVRFHGRDLFVNGTGKMLIKLNSLFNVVNERGGNLNEATMQRFLGEMVWFPSLAASPLIRWEQKDDTTVTAHMSYGGTSCSGTFVIDEHGDVREFSAMRFFGGDPSGLRKLWRMQISRYGVFAGIRVPVEMSSTWQLDEGNWTWLELTVTDVSYNNMALP